MYFCMHQPEVHSADRTIYFNLRLMSVYETIDQAYQIKPLLQDD